MRARYRVVHQIAYHFANRIEPTQLTVRLRPITTTSQAVHHYQLVVEPHPRNQATSPPDAFGNALEDVWLQGGIDTLRLTSISTVELLGVAPNPDELATLETLLTQAGVDKTPVRVSAPGICRQRAEQAINALTNANVACRYVSGYMLSSQMQRTTPHAWIAISRQDRWLEYDPTLATMATTHLRTAWGADYDDVAPVSGTVETSGPYRLVSTVSVEPLAPR